jgi:hypothetical protein
MASRIGTYIVGAATGNGGMLFDKRYEVHITEESAMVEAARCAGITPKTPFIVAKIIGEIEGTTYGIAEIVNKVK